MIATGQDEHGPCHFVIVGMGRTGSTMLASMLDSHPDIECRGELFGPEGAFRSSGLSRRVFLEKAAYLTDAPTRGFKMPFDWILDFPGIFGDLGELGYRVIRLTRRHSVKHFLSALLAERNHDWSSQSVHSLQSVEMNPWDFMAFVGQAYISNFMMDRMTDRLPHHAVSYEDILGADSQATILRFLGARPHQLTPSTVRARTRPLHEAIQNYSDLVRFFLNGPYAPLFPPAPGDGAVPA